MKYKFSYFIIIIAAMVLSQSAGSPASAINRTDKKPAKVFNASAQNESLSTVNTQVDSKLPWQDSGVFVQANEVITLEVVSGQWTDWVGVVPYNNGTGSDYICTDYLPYDECVEPMPDERKGSLIGKIGDDLFAIGSGTTYTAQQSGYLYMRINDPDDSLYDNDGILTVQINTNAECEVPFYSQRDPLWAEHPLRTNGECSSYCGKIGTCGCTLTSASMLFTYYGADLNPPTLSDLMDKFACKFHWYVADDYTNGKASFVNKYAFSYSRLEQELNLNNRPVILGMHKQGDLGDTHWVLVVGGQGNSASGYTVHDPWPLDGDYQNLSVLERDNYAFDWISVYAGEPACSKISVVSDESEIINPTRVAAAEDSTDRSNLDQNEGVSLPDVSSDITGTVYLYERTYLMMTLQISATSTLGDVTEMRVWTDTIPDTDWQPFAEFAVMEWYPEDEGIYAQFKDELDNISDVATDTVRPVFSPPQEAIEIYLPLTIKGN